jgi:hypothetical protein
VDAGYDAAYLDSCTIYDLDALVKATNKLREKQGWKPIK